MIGTTVFFRDSIKGWVLGTVVELLDGGEVICCGQNDSRKVRVVGDDVAVAREEALQDVPSDLSMLSALHPATLILALKKRFLQGCPSTAVGPYTTLYLNPGFDHNLAEMIAHDARKADAFNLPKIYPEHIPRSRYLRDEANRGLLEPIGWWTTAKDGYSTAMSLGHGLVPAACGGKTRREDEKRAIVEVKLGSQVTVLPPREELFDDDLMYSSETKFPSAELPSQRLELAACRMGHGRWVAPTPLTPNTHRKLASLLADGHLLLDLFFSGGPHKRSPHGGLQGARDNVHSAELSAAETPGSGPGYSRHTRLFYDKVTGVTAGWALKCFWTAKGAARWPPNAFRILANGAGKTAFLGPHTHSSWESPVPFIASGDAFREVNLLLNGLGVPPRDIEHLWSVVAAVMLLKVARIEEVSGRARLFCDHLDEIGQLLAVTADRLKTALLPPTRKFSRVAAAGRRDALCFSLYEGVGQWVVDVLNRKAAPALPRAECCVLDVLAVPGLVRPNAGEFGGISELCHNISVDALWGLYHDAIFETNLTLAAAEACPRDPLLNQLKEKPLLDQLNPHLQTLSHLDIEVTAPSAVSATVDHPTVRKDCTHTTGDIVHYDLCPLPPPPLAQLYNAGFRETPTAAFLQHVLPKCPRSSLASEAISAMSDLIAIAKNRETPRAQESANFWFIWMASEAAAPSLTPLPLDAANSPWTDPFPFNGITVENEIYACRVVETALLCRVGHSVILPLTRFVSLFKCIAYPLRVRDTGLHRSAQSVAETVFGDQSEAWNEILELDPLPASPVPLHIGHSRALLTHPAYTRLERFRAFTMNKLAVLIQMFAKSAVWRRESRAHTNSLIIQRSVRSWQSKTVAAVLFKGKALRQITHDLDRMADRRLAWRVGKGLQDSPVPYLKLTRLLTQQKKDRGQSAATWLGEHRALAEREIEEMTRLWATDSRRLREFLHSEQKRVFQEDEAALRVYLTDREQTGRMFYYANVGLPLTLEVEHERLRGIIVHAETNERAVMWMMEYQYSRDRIMLREAAARLSLVLGGNFMLKHGEEGNNRKIVEHSESRCWDLLVREFTLGVLHVGGLLELRPGFADGKVEFEPLRRGLLAQAETFHRRNICLALVQNVEATCRAQFLSQCTAWLVRAHTASRPALIIGHWKGRVTLRATEQKLRFDLARAELRARERSGRIVLFSRIEARHKAIFALHDTIQDEKRRRAAAETQEKKLRNRVCEGWVAQRVVVLLSPNEEKSRAWVEKCQEFCVHHMLSRCGVVSYQEADFRKEIYRHMTEDRSLLTVVESELLRLHSEHNTVRQNLSKRVPIVQRVFQPQDYLVPVSEEPGGQSSSNLQSQTNSGPPKLKNSPTTGYAVPSSARKKRGQAAAHDEKQSGSATENRTAGLAGASASKLRTRSEPEEDAGRWEPSAAAEPAVLRGAASPHSVFQSQFPRVASASPAHLGSCCSVCRQGPVVGGSCQVCGQRAASVSPWAGPRGSGNCVDRKSPGMMACPPPSTAHASLSPRHANRAVVDNFCIRCRTTFRGAACARCQYLAASSVRSFDAPSHCRTLTETFFCPTCRAPVESTPQGTCPMCHRENPHDTLSQKDSQRNVHTHKPRHTSVDIPVIHQGFCGACDVNYIGKHCPRCSRTGDPSAFADPMHMKSSSQAASDTRTSSVASGSEERECPRAPFSSTSFGNFDPKQMAEGGAAELPARPTAESNSRRSGKVRGGTLSYPPQPPTNRHHATPLVPPPSTASVLPDRVSQHAQSLFQDFAKQLKTAPPPTQPHENYGAPENHPSSKLVPDGRFSEATRVLGTLLRTAEARENSASASAREPGNPRDSPSSSSFTRTVSGPIEPRSKQGRTLQDPVCPLKTNTILEQRNSDSQATSRLLPPRSPAHPGASIDALKSNPMAASSLPSPPATVKRLSQPTVPPTTPAANKYDASRLPNPFSPDFSKQGPPAEPMHATYSSQTPLRSAPIPRPAMASPTHDLRSAASALDRTIEHLTLLSSSQRFSDPSPASSDALAPGRVHQGLTTFSFSDVFDAT
ncbi:hypothetical protein DIPPA_21466 [Diplonema papillatum]|nr:hypothetical protein DIPPA_21466 [Diplonema papillatum]